MMFHGAHDDGTAAKAENLNFGADPYGLASGISGNARHRSPWTNTRPPKSPTTGCRTTPISPTIPSRPVLTRYWRILQHATPAAAKKSTASSARIQST